MSYHQSGTECRQINHHDAIKQQSRFASYTSKAQYQTFFLSAEQAVPVQKLHRSECAFQFSKQSIKYYLRFIFGSLLDFQFNRVSGVSICMFLLLLVYR